MLKQFCVKREIKDVNLWKGFTIEYLINQKILFVLLPAFWDEVTAVYNAIFGYIQHHKSVNFTVYCVENISQKCSY